MLFPYFRAVILSALVFEGFDTGWDQRWASRELGDSRNRVPVELDQGNAVLRIDSAKSAGLHFRELTLVTLTVGGISWRWKVSAPIPGSRDETTKSGDDYSARLFVLFDPLPLDRKTRAICYVWASREPIGKAYPNPYFDRVVTVVVQSGPEQAGAWVAESQNFFDDYHRYFGEAAEVVAAFAVMADTGDTGSLATMWFDDLVIE